MPYRKISDFFRSRSPWRHFLVWLIVGVSCFASTDRNLFASIVLASGLAFSFFLFAAGSASAPRPIRAVAKTIYWVSAVLGIAAFLTYGLHLRRTGHIDAEAVRAIAQTDLFEAINYLMFNTTWEAAVMGAAITVLLVLTYPTSVTRQELGLSSRQSWMLAPAVAGFIVFGGGFPIAKPIYLYVSTYKEQLAAFQAILGSRKTQIPTNATTDFEGTVIVVIGESTARRHLGLYGYFRDTTPLLSARRDELVVFQDVVAPHTHTVPVLTSALTLAGTRRDLSFSSEDAIDIISLAKAAGYETFWFSNQNEFGMWDNPISVLAHGADHTRFFSPTLGKVFRRLILDQEMLPFVNDAISSSSARRKVVFVHLFATHIPYCDAYPARFRRFREPLGKALFGRAKTQPRVNCYDDAVAYVDWLLDSMIRQAADRSEPVNLIYFSDHGEAPLLGSGHESSMHSAYQVEVPLLLWANDSYQAKYPDTLPSAGRNARRSYSLSRLFHTLGELLHIDSKSIEPVHSILSDSFREQKRVLLGGRIRYDEWSPGNDYRENARIFLRETASARPKIWSHRTNSLGALMEAKELFSGLEFDLVFNADDKRFQVRHPPNSETGLVLEDVLAALASRPDMRLWFDWKNASAANIAAAVSRLNQLDETYHIRRRALVETDSAAIFEGLRSISAEGYLHGYYLPTKQILECLKECSQSRREDLSKTLMERIDSGGFAAVTYDWRLRPFVEAQLAEFIEERNLKQFSWDLSINVARDIGRAEEMVERTSDLDALLVVFPSVFKI